MHCHYPPLQPSLVGQVYAVACDHAPTMTIDGKIRSLLAEYCACDAAAITIVPLHDGVSNCYNNSNFLITIGSDKYFAKYGNPHGQLLGTALANDIVCRTIASSYGVSPPVLLYDAEKTIMVTAFIEESGAVDLKDRTTQKRYVALLRTLHRSGAAFPQVFCPYRAIQQYVDYAHAIGLSLPDPLVRVILPAIASFQEDEIITDLAPCHLDPQASNVLDTGSALTLIDWECAAMTDPLFDLACMCSIEEFCDGAMADILTLYLQRHPTAVELRRFFVMRLLADVRYCAYCYLQTRLSATRRELFHTFAQGFLDRSLAQIHKLKP